MIIDPTAKTKLHRSFESPLGFVASLRIATIKRVAAVAALESNRVQAVIEDGYSTPRPVNSELRRLAWLRDRLTDVEQTARALVAADEDGLQVVNQRKPEPDTTYTLLDGLSTDTLTRVKHAVLLEAEPLRAKRQQQGAGRMSGGEAMRFSLLNTTLVILNEILTQRGHTALALANYVNEDGRWDYNPDLMISQ